MNIRKIAVVLVLVLSSFAASNVAPSKAELESMYDKAFREFNANNFPEALKQLDAIDARQPDLAESQNLRGVILMRQSSYDQAEQALQKALATDPKFWNARFNLAEIPFLKKDWPEARNRFQGLLFGNALELQGEALQLIQYKILLTYLLENKENMVDSILTKLELTPDTPAVHYANAAIAFQKKNEKEAKDWLAAAEKNFTPQLNKLFAESLYEVGWITKPAGQTRPAVELTSAADRAAKAKGLARAKFDQAEQAFAQRDFTAARKLIDEAETADPNQAPYINLRGEILLAQKDFDAAEGAFKQAAKVDPKFREAQYNLAQIPFKKKDYAKARERYEALFSSTPAPSADATKDQGAQLIKFKVFLTLLLEGKDSRAQKMMEQFQFTGDTPALYYAQAAWEFKHNNAAKANDWVTSARKIYAPAMNMVFADAFYDLGWLQNAPVVPGSNAKEIAKTEASPSIEPSPIPGAALAANTAKQPPQTAPQKSPETTVAGMEATTERSPAAATQPVVNANGEAASTPAPALSPRVETPVASNAAPAEARAPLPPEHEQPVPPPTTQPVTTAAKEPAAPGVAPATSSSIIAQTKPDSTKPTVPVPVASAAVAATSASASPATVLAPATVREWSKPSATETLENFMNPRALLVGALLVAAMIIIASVVIPALRRRIPSGTATRSVPQTAQPRYAAVGGPEIEEAVAVRPSLAGGPRQVSLQLKASEPSVRRAAVPFGKGNKPFVTGASAAVLEPSLEHEPISVLDPEMEDMDGGSVGEPSAVADEALDVTAAAPIDHMVAQASPEEPAVAEPQAPAAADFAAETVATDQPIMETAANFVSEPEMAPAVPESIASEFIASEPVASETEASFVPGIVATPMIAAPDLVEPTIAVPEVTAPAFSEVEQPPIAAFAPVALHLPDEVPAARAEEETVAELPAVAEQEPPAVVEAATTDSFEPIGQGQPIPYLTPAEPAVEPSAPIARADVPSEPSRIAEGVAAGAALAGIGALRHSVETPAFAPTVVSNETQNQQPTPPATMPPPTQPTPASAIRTAPMTGGAPQPPVAGGAPQAQPQAPQSAGGMQTAVQLTFSFEIASLQLTPSFKMGALQLRPTSRIVTMRLAPSQQPQPAMNLQVTFEIAQVQVAGGGLGQLRLTPSQQQRPMVAGTSAFSIAGLQLLSGADAGAVQLTPAQQGQGSVQITARFQIATVEFSPSFEIAALVLNSASRSVAVQLPGNQGPIDGAPVFDISNVQLGGAGEIAMMQLNPQGGGAPRPA
ncbi:MAG: tetratricopeptide repeat protein [Verrucomicrobiota bacterium]|nr:tetratricopeptide repeat protein [Verrucomicrobiota bacterium]